MQDIIFLQLSVFSFKMHPCHWLNYLGFWEFAHLTHPRPPQLHCSSTGGDDIQTVKMTDSAKALLVFGRKKRIDIWTNFLYNSVENKTHCTATAGEGETPCGFKLVGKNTTNLKRHLKAHHPAIYATIPETSTPKQQPGAKNKQSTIPAAFSSSGPKYKADSLEQGTKEKVIAQWIGRTGLPARTVEDEDFILMIETFDKRRSAFLKLNRDQ
nr:uncharacterized protein LOC117440812 [Pseudochaenichthys georgianus]XP_033942602.1 uncharacterized protein LOC117449217 [Pseudochaenichthys georgianus]XP_033947580.1 uncharacterized protein LOC117452886 [Pseudochaenichthys georgianus]XP_033966284.1 uncharacterized protein LOC117466896 [Pseudochaenichthys georgianus]